MKFKAKKIFLDISYLGEWGGFRDNFLYFLYKIRKLNDYEDKNYVPLMCKLA